MAEAAPSTYDTALASSGGAPSTFDQASGGANLPTSQLNQLLHAYQTGAMAPADAQQFESDIHAGLITIPDNIHVAGKPAADASKPVTELPKPVIDAYNTAATDPYAKGAMDYASRKQLDSDIAAGNVKLPSGTVLNQSYVGNQGNIIQSVGEKITGNLRATPETQNNPDYEHMPELNSQGKSFANLGVLLASNPDEAVKVIQSNYPNVAISQDAHGNYLLKSAVDGNTYAIKPGMDALDIGKVITAVAAFSPAGKATTITGGALAAGATEAGLQATKAAAGGDAIDPTSIAIAAATGGAVPVAGKIYNAGKSAFGAGAKAAEGAAGAETQAAAKTASGEASAPISTTTATPATTPEAAMPSREGSHIAYQAPEGTYTKEGGSMSWRTNNEGNLKDGPFARENGAIASNNGFAVFPTPEAGRAAKEALLFNSPAYKDLNVGQAISRYAPPAENDTSAYVKSIFDKTGISPATPMSSLSAEQRASLMDAMKAHEGWQVGKETVNGAAQDVTKAAPEAAASTTGEAAPATATPASATPATPLSTSELSQMAMKAAKGDANAGAALAQQAAPDADMLAAAKSLGVQNDVPVGAMAANPSYRTFEATMGSAPGSAIKAQTVAGLQNVADRATKIATDAGSATGLGVTDAAVKDSLSASHAALDQKASRLYDAVRAGIPAQAPAEAPNVLGFIKQQAEDLGGAQNLSPMEKQILSKLSPKPIAPTSAPTVSSAKAVSGEPQTISPAEYKAMMAGGSSGGAVKQPTYALLDNVRKDIGDGLQNKGVFKDANTGLKKKLYGLLAQDQAAVANQHGMGDTLAAAQQAVAQRKGIEEHLTALFGKEVNGSIVGKIGAGMNAASSGDVSKLIQIIKHTPDNLKQQVVASGLTTVFQRGGKMSFTDYAKWYEGLQKNPKAYNAIMSNLPAETQSQLKSLYTLSKGIKSYTDQAITTGRVSEGIIAGMRQQSSDLVTRLYDAATNISKNAGKAVMMDLVGGHGAGMATAVLSALKGGVKTDAVKAVDTMLASPEFQSAARQIAVGNTKQGASILAYSKPFLQFARALGNPREMTNKEKWVMQALEADNNNSKN